MRKSSTSLLSTAVALVAVVLPAAPAVAAVGAPAAHAITAPRAVSSTDAINAHYAALGGGRSFLGNPVGGETAVAGGAVQNYDGGAIYWSSATGAWSVHGAILDKYKALGGPAGVLGFPLTDELGTPDGVGRFNHFTGNGAGASIYWTPKTGAQSVRGAIRAHWQALGWETGPMGYPITDELGTPDGVGRFNHFTGKDGTGASIYWTPRGGAWSVRGAIRQHWAALGWETGPMGYPTTDELGTPDGVGRFNHFEGSGDGASIYWTPKTGAQSVEGPLRDHWQALGWETGPMGYPTTDLQATPDGLGYYNHFTGKDGTGASIYWTFDTGAWSVQGAIRAAWAGQGWETGPLGYPTSDEYAVTGGRQNDFTGGTITWNAATGHITITTHPVAAPAAVADLAATAANHGATLTFTAPADNGAAISGYEYTLDGGDSWKALEYSANGSAITGTVTGLTNGTNYSVQVRADNRAGNGAASTAVTVTPAAVPAAIDNLTAEAGDSSTIVSFTAPADNGSAITGYQVSTNGGTSWNALEYSADGSAITGTVTGLTNGTNYSVQVRAINGEGNGPASTTATVTPAAAPAAVADLAATPANHGATLTFTAPDANGAAISGYEVSTDGGDTWNPLEYSADGSAITITVTGLTNGTAYNVEVRAINSAGTGAASGATTVTPAAVPAAIDDLTATPADGSAALSFTAPAANGSAITGYQVSTDGGGSWNTLTTTISGTTVTGTVTGLTNGTAYNVKVRAANGEGNGPASTTATVTPAAVPAAVADLTVDFSNGTAALTFTAPAANGAAILGYEVTTDGGDTWNPLPTTTSGSAVTGTVTGLTNDQSYTVLVRADNSAGTGQPSNSVTGTPTAQVPSTIADLTAQAGNGQAALTFTAPADNGATISGYEVSVNGSWTELTTSTDGSTVTGTVTGLTNGNTYTLRVRADNSAGSGNASTPVTVTPAPAAPSTVQDLAATPGSHTATLTFTAPSANGTAIQRYEYTTNGGTSWAPLTGLTASGQQLTTTVTNDSTGFSLANGTNYAFQIRAVNAVGNGQPSNVANVTPATAPSAVSNLAATPGNGTATLTFTAPANNGGATITGYEVSTDAGGTWNTLDYSTDGSTITGTVTGLANGTTYNVQVRADNIAGNGAAATTSVTPAAQVPSTIADLSAARGDSSATLTFTAPAANGAPITSYDYRIGSGSWTALTGYTTSGTTVTGTVSGLTNGTAYTLQVRANNSAGNGTGSNTATVTPAAVPAAIGNLTAQPGNTTAALTFTAPAANGAPIFGYQASTDGGGTWNTLPGYTISGTTVTVTVTGLTNGTTYNVKVRAMNDVGNGTASNNATVTPAAAPAAVGDLTATPGNGSAALSFTAPATNGAAISGYQVSTDGGTSWNPLGTTTSGTTVTGTVSGLTNGTAYNLQVRATNSAGNGTGSNTVSVTPAAAPAAVGDLTAQPRNASAALSFTAPATNGAAISGYQVSTDGGTSWNPLTGYTTSGNTVTGTVSGLTNGTVYSVKVRAINSAGTGAASNTATVTPAAQAPSAIADLSATRGDSSATLTFTAPAANGAAITSYDYRIGNGSWTALTGATTSGGTVTGTVTGLTNGTAYTLQVRANNSVGGGTASNAFTVTPAAVPAAVSDLAAQSRNGGAALTFTVPAANGAAISSYQVSTDGGTTWNTLTATISGSTVTGTVTGLTNGTAYNVKVRAVNNVGNGTASNTAAVTPAATVPVAVTDLSATPGDGNVALSFTPPNNGGSSITKYEYSTDGGVSWLQLTTLVPQGSQLSETVSFDSTGVALINGQSYTFVVRADNTVGNGANSNTVPVTVGTVAP